MREKYVNVWANGLIGPLYPKQLDEFVEAYDNGTWTLQVLQEIGAEVAGFSHLGNLHTTGKLVWFQAMFFKTAPAGLGKVVLQLPWGLGCGNMMDSPRHDPYPAIYCNLPGLFAAARIVRELTQQMLE